MRSSLACAVVLVSAALHAHSRPPDLSGRGRLVEPSAAQRAVDTLAVTSPDQLLITHTATYPLNDRGVRVTIATGSMWRLDSADRLAIEFGEERAGERPKVATRVYVKVAPQ